MIRTTEVECEVSVPYFLTRLIFYVIWLVPIPCFSSGSDTNQSKDPRSEIEGITPLLSQNQDKRTFYFSFWT